MKTEKKIHSWIVEEESSGERLDKWLTAHLEDVSRTRVQLLIEKEKVMVNGGASSVNYRVMSGDKVEVTGELQPPPLRAEAEDIPLDIVYEDDLLAVINKPAGMTVHVGAGHAPEEEDDEPDPRMHGTLVNALLYHFKKLSKEGGELRPGIVHRLDKDTSGLIVVAKNDVVHRKLAEQFSSRQVHKKYIALVHGWPKAETGEIHKAIGRDRRHRHRMAIDVCNGRDALSRYRTIEHWNTAYGKFALVEVEIATGRTHQIRVHLSSIGLQIVGDTLYGAPHQITLLGSARPRAERVDTKATRNRAAMELAREMTEAKMGEGTVAKKKTKIAQKLWDKLPLNISLPRQFLHAAELEFTHPKNRKQLKNTSNLPKDLKIFHEQIKQAAL